VLKEHYCSFNRLNEQPFVQPVVKPRCTTGLTTVLNEQSLFDTIQPFVKPVVERIGQPVCQQVVSCKRGFRVLKQRRVGGGDSVVAPGGAPVEGGLLMCPILSAIEFLWIFAYCC